MSSSLLVALPVMVILTIVQTTVLPRLPLFEVIPSLPFLVALAWSLLSSLEEGIVWAFIGGLFMDIFTIAPVGGLSLTYMAATVGASLIYDLLPANRIVVPTLTAAVATMLQQLLYMLYLRLFGITISVSLTGILQIIMENVFVFLPIYWLLYLIRRAIKPSPVKI